MKKSGVLYMRKINASFDIMKKKYIYMNKTKSINEN
jgi:hypothetical protein